MVWLCADKETTFPPYIRIVKMWSLRHYYELATAGAIVSNVRIDLGVEKEKNRLIYKHGMDHLVQKELKVRH